MKGGPTVAGADFEAFHVTKDRVYYVQTGEGIRYSVTFAMPDSDQPKTKIKVSVIASSIFDAIAKAAPIAKKAYPTSCGKLRSERFLEYVQILVKKSHD